MEVRLEHLTKRWGKVTAVDDMNLDIRSGEFVAFLGPSGCGKTTTLLMIAGIYKPTSGFIKFDGRVVNKLPPKDRNVGMVFQSYALYPHMTVYENLTFPLKLKGVPEKEQREKAQRIADMMGIGHLMDRYPAQLSGGQQQRVALGRALIKEPALLLFDEPLSNLDARLRLTMRAEIKRLQMDLGITSIYVTHDQVEAMTMADRIAVMRDGKLQAFATPEELYERPRTLFVAGFIGNPPMNFMDVEVVQEGERYYAVNPDLRLEVDPERGAKAAGRGRVIMGIRPEHIRLAQEGETPDLQGEVFLVEPLGRDDLINVTVGQTHLHFLVDPALKLNIGDRIQLKVDTSRVQFFDPVTERSLLWT